MSLMTFVAVLVKHLGATLCMIKAGTNSCNFTAVFSAVTMCCNPVSLTLFKCALHCLLNIVVHHYLFPSRCFIRFSSSSIFFVTWGYFLRHTSAGCSNQVQLQRVTKKATVKSNLAYSHSPNRVL